MQITETEISTALEFISSTGRTPTQVGRGELAEYLGVKETRARKILDRIRGLNSASAAAAVGVIEAPPSTGSVCDEMMHRYRSWVGWHDEVDCNEPIGAQDGTEKILIIGDPHCPYQSDAVLEAAAKEGADRVIINGDLTDLQNWSRHDKFGMRFTPQQEIASAQAVLNFFSETFPRVDIIPGNHDDRWIKYLVSRGVEPGILEAFRMLCPGFDSPLQLMSRELTNVHLVPRAKIGFAEFGWFCQVGDLITTHAEIYSTIPNQAVGKVIQWLQSFALPQGLVRPFKVVAQNHTHQSGCTFNNFGIVGIENGCACRLGDYCASPKAMTPRPWINGFTTLTQNNGVTDLSSIRFHFIGYAS